MRSLDIERRPRRLWPAVLAGVLVVALCAWWLVPRGAAGPDVVTVASAGSTEPFSTTPAAVSDFLRFVDDRRAADAMGPDHDYTAEGIRALSEAVAAVARASGAVDVEREATALRDRANLLQQDSRSTEHARQTRAAFDGLAAMLGTLAQQRPAAVSGVEEVRRAAEAVQPERRLLDQRAAVQSFFERAAAALRAAPGGQG